MPEDGICYALDRDAAKPLFRAKTTAELLDFLEQPLVSGCDALTVGPRWRAVHRCLSDIALDPTAGESLLNQVLLGGRPLGDGDRYHFILVRPDMVPHIAQALSELDEQQLLDCHRASAASAEHLSSWEAVHQAVTAIGEFYQRAAANQCCVLFVGLKSASGGAAGGQNP